MIQATFLVGDTAYEGPCLGGNYRFNMFLQKEDAEKAQEEYLQGWREANNR